MPSVINLMLFNFGINFLSGALLGVLLYRIFLLFGLTKKGSVARSLLLASAYLVSAEPLYSQGVIYWAQSVQQIIISLYLLLALKILSKNNVSGRDMIFLTALSIAGPQLEWTGYLVNIGMIVYLGVSFYKTHKTPFKNAAAWVSIGTLVGFLVYLLPMLYSVGGDMLISSLRERFIARTITSANDASVWLNLLKGYMDSYGPLVIATTVTSGIAMIVSEIREQFKDNIKKISGLFIIAIFAIFENVIMKQHAEAYSFDRLKLVYLIALIIACAYAVRGYGLRLIITALIIGGIMSNSFLLLRDYRNLYSYNRLEGNKEMIANIPDINNIVAVNGVVRGYVNSSLMRNAYERVYSYERLNALARLRSVDRATWLMGEPPKAGVYEWHTVASYDYTKNTIEVKVRELNCEKPSASVSQKIFPNNSFKGWKLDSPNSSILSMSEENLVFFTNHDKSINTECVSEIRFRLDR